MDSLDAAGHTPLMYAVMGKQSKVATCVFKTRAALKIKAEAAEIVMYPSHNASMSLHCDFNE